MLARFPSERRVKRRSRARSATALFGVASCLIGLAVVFGGTVEAADSEAVWLPQSRSVHMNPESLGYPPEPVPPPGASVTAPAVPATPTTESLAPPTDRRTDNNWRLRPVYERKDYDRSTIPGEDALNRPTALQFRL